MDTLSPYAYLRSERLSESYRRATAEDALERAREAVAKAKTMLRLTVQMAASAVNDELDHVPNAQAKARACILPGDVAGTCETIEQYLDDLLFQPMQLLEREAGE